MKNKNHSKLFTRVLALVLVVALVCTGLLYSAANVSLDARLQENNAAVLAAMQLLQNDAYANASVPSRMTAIMRNFVTNAKTYEDYELGAAIAIARGNYADGLVCTQMSIDSYTGDNEGLAVLYLRMGYLYTLLAAYPAAEDWLNKGLELNESADAYLVRAQVRMERNNISGAAEDAKRYLEIAEDPEMMLPNIVNIFEASGEYEALIGFYTVMLNNPDLYKTEYYLNLASAYVNMGKMVEAEETCRKYAEAGGGKTADAYTMLGIGYLRNKAYQNAADCFAKAIDENSPQTEGLYYYTVLCGYLAGDYAKAAVYGDIAVGKISDLEDPLSFGKADPASAPESGEVTLTLGDTNPAELCLMTGASQMSMNQFDKAAVSLSECIRINPQLTNAYYLRGSCYLAQENYKTAIEDFDLAIESETEVEKSRYARGLCRMKTNDMEGALEDFDWILLNGKDEELFDSSTEMIAQIINEQTKGASTDGNSTETVDTEIKD